MGRGQRALVFIAAYLLALPALLVAGAQEAPTELSADAASRYQARTAEVFAPTEGAPDVAPLDRTTSLDDVAAREITLIKDREIVVEDGPALNLTDVRGTVRLENVTLVGQSGLVAVEVDRIELENVTVRGAIHGIVLTGVREVFANRTTISAGNDGLRTDASFQQWRMTSVNGATNPIVASGKGSFQGVFVSGAHAVQLNGFKGAFLGARIASGDDGLVASGMRGVLGDVQVVKCTGAGIRVLGGNVSLEENGVRCGAVGIDLQGDAKLSRNTVQDAAVGISVSGPITVDMAEDLVQATDTALRVHYAEVTVNGAELDGVRLGVQVNDTRIDIQGSTIRGASEAALFARGADVREGGSTYARSATGIKLDGSQIVFAGGTLVEDVHIGLDADFSSVCGDDVTIEPLQPGSLALRLRASIDRCDGKDIGVIEGWNDVNLNNATRGLRATDGSSMRFFRLGMEGLDDAGTVENASSVTIDSIGGRTKTVHTLTIGGPNAGGSSHQEPLVDIDGGFLVREGSRLETRNVELPALALTRPWVDAEGSYVFDDGSSLTQENGAVDGPTLFVSRNGFLALENTTITDATRAIDIVGLPAPYDGSRSASSVLKHVTIMSPREHGVEATKGASIFMEAVEFRSRIEDCRDARVNTTAGACGEPTDYQVRLLDGSAMVATQSTFLGATKSDIWWEDLHMLPASDLFPPVTGGSRTAASPGLFDVETSFVNLTDIDAQVGLQLADVRFFHLTTKNVEGAFDRLFAPHGSLSTIEAEWDQGRPSHLNITNSTFPAVFLQRPSPDTALYGNELELAYVQNSTGVGVGIARNHFVFDETGNTHSIFGQGIWAENGAARVFSNLFTIATVEFHDSPNASIVANRFEKGDTLKLVNTTGWVASNEGTLDIRAQGETKHQVRIHQNWINGSTVSWSGPTGSIDRNSLASIYVDAKPGTPVIESNLITMKPSGVGVSLYHLGTDVLHGAYADGSRLRNNVFRSTGGYTSAVDAPHGSYTPPASGRGAGVHAEPRGIDLSSNTFEGGASVHCHTFQNADGDAIRDDRFDCSDTGAMEVDSHEFRGFAQGSPGPNANLSYELSSTQPLSTQTRDHALAPSSPEEAARCRGYVLRGVTMRLALNESGETEILVGLSVHEAGAWNGRMCDAPSDIKVSVKSPSGDRSITGASLPLKLSFTAKDFDGVKVVATLDSEVKAFGHQEKNKTLLFAPAAAIAALQSPEAYMSAALAGGLAFQAVLQALFAAVAAGAIVLATPVKDEPKGDAPPPDGPPPGDGGIGSLNRYEEAARKLQGKDAEGNPLSLTEKMALLAVREKLMDSLAEFVKKVDTRLVESPQERKDRVDSLIATIRRNEGVRDNMTDSERAQLALSGLKDEIFHDGDMDTAWAQRMMANDPILATRVDGESLLTILASGRSAEEKLELYNRALTEAKDAGDKAWLRVADMDTVEEISELTKSKYGRFHDSVAAEGDTAASALGGAIGHVSGAQQTHDAWKNAALDALDKAITYLPIAGSSTAKAVAKIAGTYAAGQVGKAAYDYLGVHNDAAETGRLGGVYGETAVHEAQQTKTDMAKAVLGGYIQGKIEDAVVSGLSHATHDISAPRAPAPHTPTPEGARGHVDPNAPRPHAPEGTRAPGPDLGATHPRAPDTRHATPELREAAGPTRAPDAPVPHRSATTDMRNVGPDAPGPDVPAAPHARPEAGPAARPAAPDAPRAPDAPNAPDVPRPRAEGPQPGRPAGPDRPARADMATQRAPETAHARSDAPTERMASGAAPDSPSTRAPESPGGRPIAERTAQRLDPSQLSERLADEHATAPGQTQRLTAEQLADARGRTGAGDTQRLSPEDLAQARSGRGETQKLSPEEMRQQRLNDAIDAEAKVAREERIARESAEAKPRAERVPQERGEMHRNAEEGGMVPAHAEATAKALDKHDAEMFVNNTNRTPELETGDAFPKDMGAKGKSSEDPNILGYIPKDQSLGKAADSGKLDYYQKQVDASIEAKAKPIEFVMPDGSVKRGEARYVEMEIDGRIEGKVNVLGREIKWEDGTVTRKPLVADYDAVGIGTKETRPLDLPDAQMGEVSGPQRRVVNDVNIAQGRADNPTMPHGAGNEAPVNAGLNFPMTHIHDGRVDIIPDEAGLITAWNDMEARGRHASPNPDWGWKRDEATSLWVKDEGFVAAEKVQKAYDAQMKAVAAAKEGGPLMTREEGDFEPAGIYDMPDEIPRGGFPEKVDRLGTEVAFQKSGGEEEALSAAESALRDVGGDAAVRRASAAGEARAAEIKARDPDKDPDHTPRLNALVEERIRLEDPGKLLTHDQATKLRELATRAHTGELTKADLKPFVALVKKDPEYFTKLTERGIVSDGEFQGALNPEEASKLTSAVRKLMGGGR